MSRPKVAFRACILMCHSSNATQVLVLCVPIAVLEELADIPRDLVFFSNSVELPFHVLHESWTECDVGQLALEHMDNQLVLLAVHRPRGLVFHYLESGKRGNILLGPVHPYSTLVRARLSWGPHH